MQTFKKIRSELTLTGGGLLLKGTKMVVPTKLQERVVELAHKGHQEILKTKHLIREKAYMLGFPHSARDSRIHIKSPELPRGKPDLPQFQRNLSEQQSILIRISHFL